MEGTTHQLTSMCMHGKCEMQMALRQLVPDPLQDVALEPVFLMEVSLMRVGLSMTRSTSLTGTVESAGLGKGGTTKNASDARRFFRDANKLYTNQHTKRIFQLRNMRCALRHGTLQYTTLNSTLHTDPIRYAMYLEWPRRRRPNAYGARGRCILRPCIRSI